MVGEVAVGLRASTKMITFVTVEGIPAAAKSGCWRTSPGLRSAKVMVVPTFAPVAVSKQVMSTVMFWFVPLMSVFRTPMLVRIFPAMSGDASCRARNRRASCRRSRRRATRCRRTPPFPGSRRTPRGGCTSARRRWLPSRCSREGCRTSRAACRSSPDWLPAGEGPACSDNR